ncbi:glycolate oxidase FAD binding subunit [Variovorax sp. HW608]|uniref:FAD-binding protein n=1 Tax=Variovorax sp. HW608 TaxID=1034889 RepID=UPI00081FB6DF|nr:FAD-binding protein [Variovorax sp. HW608]SCK14351.1 glycolate oxidase FAD binding subunit [Variovorax sp. HW608]
MPFDLRPATEAELCDVVADAAHSGTRLSLRSGGSKRDIGAPIGEARTVDLRRFAGIVDYDPPELMLTVRPGTPLAEIEALVASKNQMLPFEPFDHGPLFGRAPSEATIGGIVAAGVAGSRRVSSGSARDHLLAVRAVSGRGECFVGGAKVVKNVTGYDIPKLIAGSWGRLAAITELTLKVLPAPRADATQILTGLDPEQAVAAMAAAMGSKADVAAAAHRPGSTSVTAFRIQGFPASVAARCKGLAKHLAAFGHLHDPGEEEAQGIWSDLRTLAPLPLDVPLWRISVPPAAGGTLVRRLEQRGANWLLDWAGGLAWVATAIEGVREEAAAAGGHCTLVRGPAELRARVPALHPPAPAIQALEQRVRRAFDPAGVFETGRF